MAEALVTKACSFCLGCLDEPKLLPCSHNVCKKCVITILKKTTEIPSGCPSCHHSILPSDEKGGIDLDVFVDNLPTDYVTWMKIQSQKLLSDTACSVCDNDSEATSFCFQCNQKMCSNCTKFHSNLSVLSDHTVEELSCLTVELLTAKKCMPCNLHKERLVEKYCSAHGELICALCAYDYHKDCDGVEDIVVSAEMKRKDLEQQNKNLKQKERFLSDEIEDLNKQISEAQAKFDRMRKEVISTFTGIIKCYEARKNKVLDDIDQKEQTWFEEKLANRDQLEALRSDVAAHTISIDEMISSAEDSGMALLATLGQLKSRLDDLETKKAMTQDRVTVGEVYFDTKLVDSLKKMAGITGEVRDSSHEQDKMDLFKCLVCDTVTEGTFQYEVLTENLSETSHRPFSKSCIIRNIP